MKNINKFIWLKIGLNGYDVWPHFDEYTPKETHRLFVDEFNPAFRKSLIIGTKDAKTIFRKFL